MAKSAPLALRETRHPFTLGLAQVLNQHQLAPAELAEKKGELAFLVQESAKTFGFKTRESLDMALEITLGLLSFALVHATQGASAVETWAEQIRKQSWKEMAKTSVDLIRQDKTDFENFKFALPPEESFENIPLRDELTRLSTARTQGVWRGYAHFDELSRQRASAKSQDRLALWLARHFKVNLPKNSDSFHLTEHLTADEAINTLLFRHSAGLGFGPRLLLGSTDFLKANRAYKAAPETWVKEAHQRFLLLLGILPVEHLSTLGKTWFKKHLAGGPPSLAKQQGEDPGAQAGISGVYYYDVAEYDLFPDDEADQPAPVKKARKRPQNSKP